jgi:hypothetical protein
MTHIFGSLSMWRALETRTELRDVIRYPEMGADVNIIGTRLTSPLIMGWISSNFSALEGSIFPSGGNESALHQSLKVWPWHSTPKM